MEDREGGGGGGEGGVLVWAVAASAVEEREMVLVEGVCKKAVMSPESKSSLSPRAGPPTAQRQRHHSPSHSFVVRPSGVKGERVTAICQHGGKKKDCYNPKRLFPMFLCGNSPYFPYIAGDTQHCHYLYIDV